MIPACGRRVALGLQPATIEPMELGEQIWYGGEEPVAVKAKEAVVRAQCSAWINSETLEETCLTEISECRHQSSSSWQVAVPGSH